MKKTKKLAALLLAAVMTVSLAACSNSTTDTPPASSSSQSTTANSDAEQGQGTDNTADAGDTAGSYDLASTKFSYVTEFHDGYAWVIEPENRTYLLIDKTGKVKFRTNVKTEEADGPISYMNGVGHIGSTIYDSDGNVTYTLNNDQDNDGIKEEMILQGGDMFLINRTVKTYNENSSNWAVIDKNGADLITPFNNEYIMGSWYYIGDGIFCNTDIEYGKACYSYHDNFYGYLNVKANRFYSKKDLSVETLKYSGTGFKNCVAENGKAWMHYSNSDQKGPALYDFNTAKYQLIETQGKKQLSSGDWYISGKTAYVNGGVYDLSGNKIADFSLDAYADMTIEYIGDYSQEGYIPIGFVGKDKEHYITYLDKNGKEQFTPIKSKEFKANATHFIVEDNNNTVLYDHTGTVKNSVPNRTNVILGEGYFACGEQYYFF